jgi:hypothetical protein
MNKDMVAVTGTATCASALILPMTLARRLIGILSKVMQLLKEFTGLAGEQPVIREALDSRHRAENAWRDRDRANDRNDREFPVKERAWLGHDQIGLEVLPAGRYIEREIAKCHIIRWRKRVARLVVPGLEMHGLGRADAEQDSQDHRIGDSQGQCRVEAGAALLDKAEMERRRVGDGLDVVRISYIERGDCRMRLPFDEQRWDHLRKNERRIKIGILVAAAIPRPPTGIDDKLHEIGYS